MLVISEMGVGRLTGNEQNIVLEVLVGECLEPAQVAMLINVNVADAKDASFPPGKVGVHGVPLRAPPPVRLERHVRVPQGNQWEQARHRLMKLGPTLCAHTQSFAVNAVRVKQAGTNTKERKGQ